MTEEKEIKMNIIYPVFIGMSVLVVLLLVDAPLWACIGFGYLASIHVYFGLLRKEVDAE